MDFLLTLIEIGDVLLSGGTPSKNLHDRYVNGGGHNDNYGEFFDSLSTEDKITNIDFEIYKHTEGF